MSKPTLSMIAEKSGFSLATVSYVLSGRKQFPQKTEESIRSVADDLGYPRNRSSRENRIIGMCIILQQPNFHEDIYFLDMMEGVLDCCNASGYRMILSKVLVDDPVSLSTFGGMLDEVEGVVLCNPRLDHRLEDELTARRLPYVVLGTTGNEHTSFTVDVDMKAAGYQCTEFLLEKGRRAPFFINLDSHMLQSQQRYAGFRLAMEDHGMPWDDDRHAFLPATMEDGYRIVESLLAERCPFDALITSNEIQAQGARKALLDHGISIPQKVALLSMGGTVLSLLGSPGISTLDFDPHKNGYEAAKLLFDILQKKRLQPFHLLLPGNLVERDST